MRVNTDRVGKERKKELIVGDDEGEEGESRVPRKAQVRFSAGLWLPLAPPLHQSASTADSRSCNDLPLRPFCLPFFFLASYTFKYSQLPSHPLDIIVHHLRIAWFSTSLQDAFYSVPFMLDSGHCIR
ncbi:hypothetical protein N7537_007009 [Penicillium hordei]|uniref:Uncharacterized protein n=1 Tax=Penicillium hordei TaxID=40994 RepID=A0AAD6E8X2_9EURO|nr:uncharacterized protein N7537_007009 [Penicillium hordei]KAJ5604053.1 hypothetical protein N7537_007009 [Penicillium hordei]